MEATQIVDFILEGSQYGVFRFSLINMHDYTHNFNGMLTKNKVTFSDIFDHPLHFSSYLEKMFGTEMWRFYFN